MKNLALSDLYLREYEIYKCLVDFSLFCFSLYIFRGNARKVKDLAPILKFEKFLVGIPIGKFLSSFFPFRLSYLHQILNQVTLGAAFLPMM